ncbi:HEAT repeat-containing protein 1-like isoform X2 [Acanthaster planci]|uniref:HEAT repeat-containing protein 1 n=1 Tax=Acanthaster planci TaxID=133434 RepID=A0A8B7Y3E4_ACAPL|nr:HEAT repeat-containing protein 1-like isoform X2 [Acanthaster planci]
MAEMTSLAQQLKRLAVPQAQVATVTHDRHRKSLLFDSKEAASLDQETFYALGVNGLQELENIDPSFQEFENTLFDDASKSLERSVQTQEVNSRLDRKIKHFLLQLSPFFLLKPAQKATEWLIHRFSIHEYNIDDLLACVIPYHDTKIFVRVVQLLRLQDDTNKWHWLQPIQNPGVPLSRTTLINQCFKDPGFLRFVCELVPSTIKAHRHKFAHSPDQNDPSSIDSETPSRSTEALLRVMTSFYCSAIVGTIELAKPVNEKLLSGILPYVLKGLKSKMADYQASSYMIICELAIKVKMKTDLVDPIIRSICKHLTPALAVEGLSCIAILCHTQPVQELPESAFQKLCSFTCTLSALEVLSQASNSTRLLKLFLTRLINATMHSVMEGNQNCQMEGGELMCAVMKEILQRVKLDATLMKEMAGLLLIKYVSVRKMLVKQASLVKQLKEQVSSIVAALERRYPEAMDLAIGTFMSQDMDSRDKEIIQELVSMSVSASKHQTISDTSTTLVMSLNHANANIRMLGVQYLGERIAAGEVMGGFFVESLLQRLRDDKLQVVNASLEIGKPLCKLLPQDKLFDILTDILRKGKRKTDKGLTSIKLSLKLLGDTCLWDLSVERRTSLVPLVLPYMFYRGPEMAEADNEIIDIIRFSTLKRDLKIFGLLNKAYWMGKKREQDSYPSVVTSCLINILARHLIKAGSDERMKMIALFMAQITQRHPHQAFYQVLLDFVLLRIAHHSKKCSKLYVAVDLLEVLKNDIKMMLVPGMSVIQPEEPLPSFSGSLGNLPQAVHAHLSNLLVQKQKQQHKEDNPRMHQSQVETTLWCLESIVGNVPVVQQLKSETYMWASVTCEGDPINVYLTWLLHLFDILTQAAGSKEKEVQHVPVFKTILTNVIRKHLLKPHLLWKFLCLVWTMPHQASSTQLYPVSPFYQARCFHVGLTSTKDTSMISEVAGQLLDQESEVLPSLLLVLSSEYEPIRAAAVHCLQALLVKLDEEELKVPYILLAQFLISKGDEIIADANYLKQALRLFFANVSSVEKAEQSEPAETPRKTKKGKHAAENLHPKIQCLNWLLVFVNKDNVPLYLQRALLSVLSEVTNEHFLSLLLDMLHSLLTQCQLRGQLENDQAVILESIIRRFIPETAAIVQHCIDDIMVALEIEKEVHPNMKPPQKLFLRQITPAFFKALPSKTLKQHVLSRLIDQQVATKNSSVAVSIRRTLRKLPLEAEQIVYELDKLPMDGKAVSLRDAKRARDNVKEPEANQWQRVIHILEFVQQKKLTKIADVVQLIPSLFTILSRCLEQDSTEPQSSIEYLKQLILTTILNICNSLSPDSDPLPVDVLSQEQFNVELIVQCIRTSEDTQTHRHALMLLATAAGLFPDHVLHNIMAIFTFMGTNMLHRDDSHSFQVISRTIETVIPALIKVNEQHTLPSTLGKDVEEVVVMVMRVFVDAFPHIPEHRRLPLFSQVMTTIGEEKYLSKMLALLIGGFVTKGAAAMHPGDDVDIRGPGRSIDFWLELCQQFSPTVEISSLTKLLEYVSTLTEDKETDKRPPSMATRHSSTRIQRHKTSPNQGPLFATDPNVRARQMRQFRFSAVCFMPYVVSSTDFMEKVVNATREESECLKRLLQRLLEVLLGYITQVAQSVHQNAGKETSKFWKALLHRCYDALDKVNALLPVHIFIDVISHLLGNKLAAVRRKAMELLNNKLLQHQDYFGEEQSESLLGLISGLLIIAMATKDQAMAPDEVNVNRHTALYSLKLLCTLLGENHVREFGPVLESSVTICEEEGVNTQVQGSAVLCLAECVRTLRAHSIRYLPHLMPRLLEVLAIKETVVSSDFLLLSAVTAVQKVVETLPHFQSPYLVDLLFQICRLSCNAEDEKSQLNLRLKALGHNLASTVAVRVLLPVFSQVYDRLVDSHQDSIGPLMGILSDHLSAMDKIDMAGYQPQIVAFFLVALDYRAKYADKSLPEVEGVEGHTINGMLTLVMKMTEGSFRPMFIKVIDWATRGSAPKERLLTLYRLSDAIANKLKSLFTLFAGHLAAKAADLLDINNTSKTDKLFFEGVVHSEEKSTLLLVYLLDCLHKCFMYDKGGFVSKERFQRLMQPLVDQIENMQGTDTDYQDRVSNHLTPCIAQFLVASHESSTWQPLNYQVLLKTRHSSAKVRFAALTVLQELHRKLAEDYLSLLPETIPFLAELMEDESVEVEQQCQLLVSELEKTLGEPLQKYF